MRRLSRQRKDWRSPESETHRSFTCLRKESRWGECHRRSDYPLQDDANWLCHVVIKMKDNHLNAEKVRISELGEEVSL